MYRIEQKFFGRFYVRSLFRRNSLLIDSLFIYLLIYSFLFFFFFFSSLKLGTSSRTRSFTISRDDLCIEGTERKEKGSRKWSDRLLYNMLNFVRYLNIIADVISTVLLNRLFILSSNIQN